MADPYVGEIKMFSGNFAPRNWAFCEGQLIPISENNTLFSLLGTRYGGDGRTNFALPDLRGRLPLHFGTGPGLTPKLIGERRGVETVLLTMDEIPSHKHNVQASSETAVQANPEAQVLAKAATATSAIYAQPESVNKASMPTDMIGHTGGNLAHSNIMPCLALHFIIALRGIFPSRS